MRDKNNFPEPLEDKNINMIKINKDLCIGCGTCEALCPAAFKLNAEAKAEAVGDGTAGCAKAAAESCPVQAIEMK